MRGMLPDTLHTLQLSERFAYAKLLAFITRVDNEVTEDEMVMFEQRMGTALLSPNQRAAIRDYLHNPPTLEECLTDLKAGEEKKAGKLALRGCSRCKAGGFRNYRVRCHGKTRIPATPPERLPVRPAWSS